MKFQFQTAKKMSKDKLTRSKYNSLLKMQKHYPVKIMTDQEKGRNWWMFQDKFYLENESLSGDEVKDFALDKRNKK